MRLALAAVALCIAACGKTPEATSSETTPEPVVSEAPAADGLPRLEQLWVAQGFSAPEGVAMAPDGNYFISNVAGEGEAKDGAGWISKISPAGAIVAEKFAEGLDAPKGMAVLDGRLYVADITRVRMIDAATGELLGETAIDGAKFLNDAAIWQGAVMVSDSETGRIWRLSGDNIELWRESEELAGVNGLLGDGDRLLVSTMSSGSLYEATAKGGWREIASGMKNADGIGVMPGGGYLVSSWPGKIHFVDAEGGVSTLLDTRKDGVLQNDLTMFGDVVIVPNWEPGTVTAWRVVR